jgi:chromosome segregation ATPase
MSAPLTPDHMQEIRERLGSTIPVRKSDAEALLAETDRLRAESDQLYSDLTGACLDRWEEAQDNIRLRQALASAQRGRRELRAALSEATRLWKERETENGKLFDQLMAAENKLDARPSRAEVLREAANALVAGPVDSLVSAPAAWVEAIETLRRMADDIEAGTPAP